MWILAICLFFQINLDAQKNDTLYFYSNHDYKIEAKDTAECFTKQFKTGDRWVRYKYRIKDIGMYMCDIDENSDSTFTKLNGMHIGYQLGVLYDSGYYKNGVRDGIWHFYYPGTRQPGMIAHFKEDKPMSFQCFSEDGSPKKENCYYEREADYPDGLSAWLDYIGRNVGRVLSRNQKALRKIGEGQYQAHIQFVVDSQGKIIDVGVRKSSGYETLDQYALEIITKSKNWIPAVQYGRLVKAYRIQPVSFQIVDYR